MPARPSRFLRRFAHFTTSKPFALPPVDVAYDVQTAERALEARGFAPTASADAPALVGFDIELRPNFSGNTTRNLPALVQLANERGCVLVHLASMRPEIPPTLRSMCADVNTLFVGTGVEHDMNDLKRSDGIECRGYVDTGAIAQTFGHRTYGLKAMSAYYGYHAEKPKSTQISNWERKPLDEKQIRYGAEDAALGLWVLKSLHAERGGKTGLIDWVRAFANGSTPGTFTSRAKQHQVPKDVADALAQYTFEERAELRTKWLAKKAMRAQKLLELISAGNVQPMSAAHMISDVLRSPQSKKTSVVWEVDEPGGDVFNVNIRLGSEIFASASAETLKKAKFEAARVALAALKNIDSQVWLRNELRLVYDA